MKKLLMALTLTTALTHGTGIFSMQPSAIPVVYNNYLVATDKTYTSLIVNGPADLKKIKVIQDMLVHGMLTATNLNVDGNLQVNGPTQLKSSNIQGKSLIMAALSADHTEFNGDLQVNGLTELKSSGVFGKTNIQVKLSTENTTLIGDVQVTGQAELQSSEIQGKMNIVGNLSASKTKFADIECSTRRMNLADCQVKSIVFRKAPRSANVLVGSFMNNINSNNINILSNLISENNMNIGSRNVVFGGLGSSGIVTINGIRFSVNSQINPIVVEDEDETEVLELTGDTTIGEVIFKSGKGKIILKNKSVIQGIVRGAKIERIEDPVVAQSRSQSQKKEESKKEESNK